MKQFIMLLCIVLLATSVFAGQLTGTKNVPGDYPTLGAAIADLNAKGVGDGGVTINLLAGHPVRTPYTITATTTAANPIVIQGNGNTIAGNTGSIFKTVHAGNITVTGFIAAKGTTRANRALKNADTRMEATVPVAEDNATQTMKADDPDK